MPFGCIAVYDEEYDEMMKEALLCEDPTSYYTTLSGEDGRRSGVMYIEGDLYNWSFLHNRYIRVLPLRYFQVGQ